MEGAMKYLIIGAGGTGGCIGAYMAEAGKDVTLIARGEHLKKINENGLKINTAFRGDYTVREPLLKANCNFYKLTKTSECLIDASDRTVLEGQKIQFEECYFYLCKRLFTSGYSAIYQKSGK